jgi:hypothetical protein
MDVCNNFASRNSTGVLVNITIANVDRYHRHPSRAVGRAPPFEGVCHKLKYLYKYPL